MTEHFHALVNSGGPVTIKQYYEELCVCARDGTFPSFRKVDSLTELGSGMLCLYRHGCKRCAAGILLPDDKYADALESKPAAYLDGLLVVPEGMTLGEVSEVQSAHDRLVNRWDPDYFLACVRAISCFKGVV